MFKKLFKRRSGRPPGGQEIEALETRRLLSSTSITFLPNVTESPDHFSGGGSPISLYVPVNGYTPQQLGVAYGIDDITFTIPTSSADNSFIVDSNGSAALTANTTAIVPVATPDINTAETNTVTIAATSNTYSSSSAGVLAGDGAPDTVQGSGYGTTIAIVDAYQDPNIESDLATFDTANSLPAPPSFKQVSQNGGSTASLKTDAGWALETSLDVEVAHATAPKADILLVEANNDNLNSLINAVNYARSAPNVAVVSMSWGGSEFANEASYDSYFTTPAGHRGVTFVASSGDSGSWFGPEWPASSDNVLSVGGTSLYSENSTGAYGEEIGWSGSGGGVSNYEVEPTYQYPVQSSGSRTTPDVSLDADPNTGVAIYDSVPDGGQSGWQVIGGTSDAAPQWAALIAIADQGRALTKSGSLDGATGTLPLLYSIASNPTTYAADFNDITRGSTSYFAMAGPGYDLVTGLGTPKAASLISALATASTKSGALTGLATKAGHATKPKKPTNPLTAARVAATPPTPVASTAARTAMVHAAVPNENLSQTTDSTPAAAPSGPAASKIDQLVNFQSPQVEQTSFVSQEVSLLETKLFDTIHIHGPIEAALPARMILEVAKLDATMFADSLRAFAHESASLGSVSANVWVRAISVSAGSLLGDLIVVGYWYHNRLRRKSNMAVAAPLIES